MWLPMRTVSAAVARDAPKKNKKNRKKRLQFSVKYGSIYLAERNSKFLGGIAQLGERLTGSQEVRGSIPLVSTRALNEAPTQVGAFFHIGTQGQRQDHDPSDRKDRALNDHCAHGSISRRGATTR